MRDSIRTETRNGIGIPTRWVGNRRVLLAYYGNYVVWCEEQDEEEDEAMIGDIEIGKTGNTLTLSVKSAYIGVI